MHITILGTGSAFSLKNYNSNILITTKNNYNLLIDAGSDIRFSLNKQDLSFKDVDAVYISHLHADHIGGLEYLALNSYFSNKKITLLCHKDIIEKLWNHSLSGGLDKITNKEMTINDYFNIIALDEDEPFIYDNISINTITTIHYKVNEENSYSYGVFLIDIYSNYKLLITTDTMFLPNIFNEYYINSDLIIHDCETSTYKTNVHSHYDDLNKLPIEIKRKMILTHYNDNVDNRFIEKAIQDGFKGFSKTGLLNHY